MSSAYDALILETLQMLAGYHAGAVERLCRGSSATLPRFNEVELLNSDLGLTMTDLAKVADGTDRSSGEGEVADMVQGVVEALWSPPGASSYDVPPDWWASGIGRMCRVAQSVVTGGEDLMTIMEAAAELGVARTTMQTMVNEGKFRSVTDPAAAHPQKGSRLLFRAEVEQLRKERER